MVPLGSKVLVGLTLALGAGLVVAGVSPTTASSGLVASVDCYQHIPGGYRVFLGYENGGTEVSAAEVGLPEVNGVPQLALTKLLPGERRAATSVDVRPGDVVTWDLGGAEVAFSSSSPGGTPACGEASALPGAGGALAGVLLTALLAGVGVHRWRRGA